VYYQPVDAPHAAAQTSANLLATAVPPASPDDRWANGFAFAGETCPQLQVFAACADPGNTDGTLSAPVYVQPSAYRLKDVCSTGQLGRDQHLARLLRQAQAVASYAVARELWTGAGTVADPFPTPALDGSTMNPYLSDGNATVLTGATSALDALGYLEQSAREQTKGQQVILHVPIRYATQVAAQLLRAGNEIRTFTDAIVVADAGYSGLGPLDGGTAEVQTVTIGGAPTGGTFTLTVPIAGAGTTAAIAFNAAASAVQTALRALPGLGGVTVTGSGPYTVTFPSTLGNVPQMTATSSLTGGTTPGVTVATTTPGVAPAPRAGNWAYATGPVLARLSPVVPTPDDDAVTVDRRTNLRTLWADRMFGVAFDPCCHYAIQFPEP
jgi:hypothetical protein